MRTARIKYLLTKPEAPHWFSDDHSYQFCGTHQFGLKQSTFDITKRPGPRFDIAVNPWWGPTITFLNVEPPPAIDSQSTTVDVWVIWDSPTYSVLFDGTIAVQKQDQQLAAAANLALPYETYESIKGSKFEYQLKKPPEPCTALEYSEVPRYVTEKYRISQGDGTETRFLNEGNNLTQQGRELFHVWLYAFAIDSIKKKSLETSDYHVAILVPDVDRGIDCYIRIVEPKTGKLAAIPVQVSEVRVGTDNLRDAVAAITDSVAKSKFKPKPNEHATLLCALLGTDGIQGVRFNVGLGPDVSTLRDLFEERGDWPYARIIISANGGLIFTTYCQPPHDHFVLVKGADSEYQCYVGRTLEEMNSTAGQSGSVTLIF